MLPMLSLGSPLAAAMMLTHISTHRSLVELVGPSWRPGHFGRSLILVSDNQLIIIMGTILKI